MADSFIDYEDLVKNALRSVVKEILLLLEKNGLQGEHHYYITFKTTDQGVKIPSRLKSLYPKDMTIVIQHRYWDLKIEESHFEIGLSFNQKPEHLVIPYASITSIVDPSEHFALQFEEPEPKEETGSEARPEESQEKAKETEAENVVSIDAFRKN